MLPSVLAALHPPQNTVDAQAQLRGMKCLLAGDTPILVYDGAVQRLRMRFDGVHLAAVEVLQDK